MYRLPSHYDRVIGSYFGSTRDQAYRYLLEYLARRSQPRVCIDIACGTGITSIWLAKQMPETSIVGVDCNMRMLHAARARARKSGVVARCAFVKRDARIVAFGDLPVNGPVDLIVCSLGYSVVPEWQVTFRNTLDLLATDGTYVIFDQYVDGLYVPDFAADQSRRSWELLERSFTKSDTTWYGNCFLSIGTGRTS
jgi:ubiquinone/menaquinone biosynthesis C-methylase UbiE